MELKKFPFDSQSVFEQANNITINFVGNHNSFVVPQSYTPTSEPDNRESVPAMDACKDKNHEELRCEDNRVGDEGGLKHPSRPGIPPPPPIPRWAAPGSPFRLSSPSSFSTPRSGNNTPSGQGGNSVPSEAKRLSELTNFCISTVHDFLMKEAANEPFQRPSDPDGVGFGQPPMRNPRFKPFPSLNEPIGLLQFTCTCLSAVQDFLVRQPGQPTPAVSQPSHQPRRNGKPFQTPICPSPPPPSSNSRSFVPPPKPSSNQRSFIPTRSPW